MVSNHTAPTRSWRFTRREKIWLGVGLFALLAFGANVEQRTALRRTPMTDLGVFSAAAGAVLSGDNLYTITDWHGWHYHYPPALAILFTPLAIPVPVAPGPLPAGVVRTAANTPWGYGIPGHHRFFGLHAENARFFCIVGIWYAVTVALIFLSGHLLASALEGRGFKEGPPIEPSERRRWWWLRLLPLLICAGSLATNLSRGQTDCLMLASIALGIYLAASGREGKAGLWLSLPATVKLFPVLLIIYPVWRLRLRMITGAIAGIVLAIAILPVVTLGPSRTSQLYREWFELLAKPALGQERQHPHPGTDRPGLEPTINPYSPSSTTGAFTICLVTIARKKRLPPKIRRLCHWRVASARRRICNGRSARGFAGRHPHHCRPAHGRRPRGQPRLPQRLFPIDTAPDRGPARLWISPPGRPRRKFQNVPRHRIFHVDRHPRPHARHRPWLRDIGAPS